MTRRHLRENLTLQKNKYPSAVKTLRLVFGNHSFGWFVALYCSLDALMLLVEFFHSTCAPVQFFMCQWKWDSAARAFLNNANIYFVTAEAAVVGILSVAVGLVTLIAQSRDTAGTSIDIQIYYNESMARQVVASCVALLLVLCIQALWPLQSILHHYQFGTVSSRYLATLTAVHALWLAINLYAVAHFIRSSLEFVQPTAREKMRERYTANEILPLDIYSLLIKAHYQLASQSIAETPKGTRPTVFFGVDWNGKAEIERDFKQETILRDVRILPLRYAINHWIRRCGQRTNAKGIASTPPSEKPLLTFVPSFDNTLSGTIPWCQRQGGVPLDWWERKLIEFSFIFERAPNQ